MTDFLEGINIVPVYNALDLYADEKARLKTEGNIVDDFDLLIGATSIVNKMVLVTNNVKHFGRMKNITIEDWTKKVRFIRFAGFPPRQINALVRRGGGLRWMRRGFFWSHYPGALPRVVTFQPAFGGLVITSGFPGLGRCPKLKSFSPSGWPIHR